VKIAMRVAALLGLIVMLGLIVHEGAGAIEQRLALGGWVLLWIVPLHAVPLMFDVLGWRTLLVPLDTERRAGLPALFAIAAVREAVNRLLPVANVGGEIVGTRLLFLRGIGVAPAGASIVIEVLLTMVAQYIFIAIGVACLLQVTGAAHLATGGLLVLALGLPIVVLAVVLFRYASVFERLGGLVERLTGARARLGEVSAQLDTNIRLLYRTRGRLLAALGWQVVGLCVGTLETWLALGWLGSPVSFSNALVLESLTQALRFFVFFVPAGLGVQEAGLVGFGNMLGVSHEAALALSLVKRMREILFGVPALLWWQWLEGRRLIWRPAE
jgi:putative membrane protein